MPVADRYSRVPFLLLSISLIVLGIWSYQSLKTTDTLYDSTFHINSQFGEPAETAKLGSSDLHVPTWDIFKPGNMWQLVSKNHPLPLDYKATHLIAIPIPHGDAGSQMLVDQSISAALKAMAAAAETAGYPLEASSAYRSISDQETLYQAFTAQYGSDFAKEYVADPGTSEHHTGLAVDLSDQSAVCNADSDKCSLGVDSAAWLQENAANYGFIQRYPEGDAPITGISFEPWHYRYVGIPLAKAISQSGLTLDEVVAQLAPGYAK